MSEVPLYGRPLPLICTRCRDGRILEESLYRGTSLIRKRPPLRPYSRPMPRAPWWSKEGVATSYERGIPVSILEESLYRFPSL